jgi:hypothetical protein
MKTNQEILELTKGYKMLNVMFNIMVSASGKNLFQYKGIKFDTYEDNMQVDDYFVFFNQNTKKALVFIKNA